MVNWVEWGDIKNQIDAGIPANDEEMQLFRLGVNQLCREWGMDEPYTLSAYEPASAYSWAADTLAPATPFEERAYDWATKNGMAGCSRREAVLAYAAWLQPSVQEMNAYDEAHVTPYAPQVMTATEAMMNATFSQEMLDKAMEYCRSQPASAIYPIYKGADALADMEAVHKGTEKPAESVVEVVATQGPPWDRKPVSEAPKAPGVNERIWEALKQAAR